MYFLLTTYCRVQSLLLMFRGTGDGSMRYLAPIDQVRGHMIVMYSRHSSLYGNQVSRVCQTKRK